MCGVTAGDSREAQLLVPRALWTLHTGCGSPSPEPEAPRSPRSYHLPCCTGERMYTVNNHSVSFCLRAQPVLLQKEQGKCCRLSTRLPENRRLQRPSHTWRRDDSGTSVHLENADGAAGPNSVIRNSWTSVWLCQPPAMGPWHVSAAYQPRFLSREAMTRVKSLPTPVGAPPYLNAWFSRLFWSAMVSTSGPPSAMNLANFSARFLTSSSSGGETLSRLSVLSSTHHTQQPNFC